MAKKPNSGLMDSAILPRFLKDSAVPVEDLAAALFPDARAKNKPEQKSGAKPAPRAKPSLSPDYLGHRERLRERFTLAADTLPDYEMLELLLFQSIPRRDVKSLAKALLARFGSFAEVLNAPEEHLLEIKGIGPSVVHQFRIVTTCCRRMAQGAIKNRDVLGSWSSVLNYCRTAMAFEETEQFRVLFLDKKNGLLCDEVLGRGTVDHTPVYPREVIRRALHHNASAMILVHNHPSGDPAPSRADAEMTDAIVRLADPLGIMVHDHLIIGRKGHASFRALGML